MAKSRSSTTPHGKATVSAVEDGDGLLVAGPACLDDRERHARVCITLMRTLSGRLREADRKHVKFAASDTVGRVARRLLDLSAPRRRVRAEAKGDLTSGPRRWRPLLRHTVDGDLGALVEETDQPGDGANFW